MFNPEQSKAIAHFLVFDAQRADIYETERQQREKEQLLREGETPEEIEALVYTISNDARQALVSYWGQFIEE
jgi:hypothetical protein